MSVKIPAKLFNRIQAHSITSPSPAVSVLVERILAQYGEAVQAVLFYGSCLHQGEDLEGLFDLYVLVDSYSSVNRNYLHASLNRLLPPNVFYLEVSWEEQTVRAKYALLSMGDLEKGTSTRWFHSYVWARFCQPTAIVYVRSKKVEEQVIAAFSQAVITFITRVLPRIPEHFTIRELWSRGLALTYRSEFRPEQPEKQVRIFDAAPDYFKDISSLAFASSPYRVDAGGGETGGSDAGVNGGSRRYHALIPASHRIVSRLSWAVRMAQGKLLSALRLIKGSLTFEGGVDYILWKIKRHSGVTMEASPFLKRHPVLAMFVLSWRLFRRGAIR